MVSREIVNPEGRRHGFLREHDADGKFARRTLCRDGLGVQSENFPYSEGGLAGDAL